MAWDLASWLVLVRTGQMVGAFVCAAMNGYLTALIYVKKLGFTNTLVALEATMCVLLFVAALMAIILHTGNRVNNISWLVGSIVADVSLSGLDVGILTIIARAGVPSNCGGLTHNPPPVPPKMQPSPYTTLGFSNQADGMKGKLDSLCALERAYYFIAIAILFSFMLTVVLTVLKIAEDRYRRGFKPDRMLYRGAGAEAGFISSYELEEDKPDDSSRMLTPASTISTSAPQPQHAASLSEGVMSARQSLRIAPVQTYHAHSHSHPHPHTHQTTVSPISPSPAEQHHHNFPPPIPQRIPTPLLASPSSPQASAAQALPPPPEKQHQPPVLVPGLASDDSQSAAAAAAMVTDGARFHSAPGGGGGPGPSRSPSTGSSAMAYHPYQQYPLPPYTPASPTAMPGHADEDNEMRLSGYVKGGTRAQAMKDGSGGGGGGGGL